MSDKNSDSKLRRRDVLKASVGSAAAFGGFPSIVRAGGDDRITIVTARDGDTVKDTREVPREWYQNWQSALLVRNQLVKRYRDDNALVSIGIGNESAQVEDHRLNSVVVTIKGEGLNDSIPEQVDGIPVQVKTTSGREPAAYKKDYDPVIGGVKVDTVGGGSGSAYCRGYYNGTNYLMSANHLVHDQKVCADVDTTNTIVYQNDDEIGDIDHVFHEFDLFLVEVTKNRSGVTDEIVSQSGSIVGARTKSGMSSDKSNDRYYEKRGISTGATRGPLDQTDMYVASCNTWGWYEASMIVEQGDSGGPVYYEDGSDLYMGFMVSTMSDETYPTHRGGQPGSWKTTLA